MLEKITKDLTEAMKNKNTFKLSVLRMLKSELKNAEINKKEALTDDEVLMVIKKQVKTRSDSMEEYINYNRQDLADSLQKEIDILNVYLPTALTEEELLKIIDETINEINPSGIAQMGLVIKAVGAKCGTRADMKVVSSVVKEKLSNM